MLRSAWMGSSGGRGDSSANRLLAKAYAAARTEAKRWAPIKSEQDAIVQEAVFRIYVGIHERRWRKLATKVAALTRVITRHAAIDRLRRGNRTPRSLDEPDAPAPSATDIGPADAAELSDLTERLRDACAELPRPQAQIAALRLDGGATRRRVAAYLHAWRGVGPHEARRLDRETTTMLRMAMQGVDLRTRFPRKFSNKNPWNTAPPPPLSR